MLEGSPAPRPPLSSSHTPLHQCTTAQMHHYTSATAHQYTNTPMHQHTNSPLQPAHSTAHNSALVVVCWLCHCSVTTSTQQYNCAILCNSNTTVRHSNTQEYNCAPQGNVLPDNTTTTTTRRRPLHPECICNQNTELFRGVIKIFPCSIYKVLGMAEKKKKE